MKPSFRELRRNLLLVILLFASALPLAATPTHAAASSLLVIERPQPDQRTAYIESTNGIISNVDWQLCSDPAGSICDDVHPNHTGTESFGGLFTSGVVSATINYVDGLSNPPQRVQGFLPVSVMSASFNHNPVNASQDFIASLSGTSGNGILQNTSWQFGTNPAQNFAPPAGNDPIFDTSSILGMGTLAVTTTQQWLDTGGSGIISNYRVRSTLTIQPMPQGEVSCGVGAEGVSIPCNTAWPNGIDKPFNASYAWSTSPALIPVHPSTESTIQFKYAPGTYTVAVEGRVPDDSTQGYYVAWRATHQFTYYPLGSANCVGNDSTRTYTCTATPPNSVPAAATYNWQYATTVHLSPPTQAVTVAGQPLLVPYECGGIVWMYAEDANHNILWEVLGTIIHGGGVDNQCERLYLPVLVS